MKNTIPLIALFSSLITLGALIAHLLSLPAKMRLPAQEYQTGRNCLITGRC